MTRQTQREQDSFARRGDEAISPIRAGLAGRCPRCGGGRLFSGFLTIAPKCGRCDLDFHGVDTGDGPAVFVILILGFVLAFAALAVEVLVRPPYWVHAALWVPLTALGAVALLRPFKGILACLQYHHGAREARGDEHDGG